MSSTDRDPFGLRELMQYRDLAIILGWHELVVRYKRSIIGPIWALAEPIFMVIIYTLIFGVFLNAGADLDNYTLYVLTGTCVWTFFNSSLLEGTSSLLAKSPFLKKAYFPRALIVLASVFSRLTTLAISLTLSIFAVFLATWMGAEIVWVRFLYWIVGIVALTSSCIGLNLVLSACQVWLRDTQFLVTFSLRLIFFLSPVVYPTSKVPESLRDFYDLNPLVSLLWLFQAPVDPSLPPLSSIAIGSGVVFVLISTVGGWLLFRRMQWRVIEML